MHALMHVVDELDLADSSPYAYSCAECCCLHIIYLRLRPINHQVFYKYMYGTIHELLLDTTCTELSYTKLCSMLFILEYFH